MKNALVVVDVVNDFVSGSLANPSALPAVEHIQRLLQRLRGRQDWLVAYVNDAHQPGDPELAIFPEHAMAGTWGAQVVEAVAPAAGDIVIPKRFYSAFTQTDLEVTCRAHDVGRVVIVGLTTDCCVRHTAYDAYLRGLQIAVVGDATAVPEALFPEPAGQRQQMSLDYVRTYYNAQIVTAADLI